MSRPVEFGSAEALARISGDDGGGTVTILDEPVLVRPSGPGALAAAGVRRRLIEGLPDAVLADYETRAEAAMVQALQQVMDTVADRIGKVQTAAGRQVWDGCPHGLHDAHDGPCP
jgi:hypothetical protein